MQIGAVGVGVADQSVNIKFKGSGLGRALDRILASQVNAQKLVQGFPLRFEIALCRGDGVFRFAELDLRLQDVQFRHRPHFVAGAGQIEGVLALIAQLLVQIQQLFLSKNQRDLLRYLRRQNLLAVHH